MMIKKISAVLCIVGAVLTMCVCCLLNTSAADGKCDLTLACKGSSDADIPSNMPWWLFRIGSMVDGKIVLEGDFAQYADTVSFGAMETSDLADAASTLESYAFVNKMAHYAKKMTDKNGTVTFEDVPAGIYLVAAKRHKVHPITYIPSPTIVQITGNEEAPLICYPKIKSIPTLAGEFERYQVRKVWENDETQPEKPTAVTIEIYRDFEPYQTVTLDDANKWTFSWEELSDSDWRIIEKNIPDGCTVTYRGNEQRFVCVNTYEDTSTPESTTTKVTHLAGENTVTTATATGPIGGGDETKTTAEETQTATTAAADINNTMTTAKTTKSTKAASSKTTTTTTSKLPQTGQLWWPVPLMALVGILFIGIGCRLISGDEKEENK